MSVACSSESPTFEHFVAHFKGRFDSTPKTNNSKLLLGAAAQQQQAECDTDSFNEGDSKMFGTNCRV